MKQNVFYCHIPKTGGLSIREMLVDYYGEEDYFDVVHVFTEWKHDKREPALFFGHCNISLRTVLPDDVYTMTMLRHPVDRLISYWKHVYREGVEARPDMADVINLPVDEVVHHPFFSDNSMVCILGTHSEMYNYLWTVVNEVAEFKPHRLKYTEEHPYNLTIEQALTNSKELLDNIQFGIFEQYDESVKHLLTPLGIEYNIPKVNAAPVTQEHPFTEEHIKIITEYQKQDIELYEYAVELFNKRIADAK